MIRILHTIDTTGPGGAETVFVNLIKGLDRTRFQPTVVIGGPGWVCDELRKGGIEPIFIDAKGTFNIAYLLGLVKIIRKNRIDIIQSHLLGANLYSSMAGLISGVPVVSTFHGFVDVKARERFSKLKSRIINLGSKIIVFVSDGLRKYYVEQKGISAGKSVVIYNGVDTSIFRPERDDSVRKKLGLGPENILVGAVGNIRPAKGYDYLLRAARLVVDRCPAFRFVVAGEGTGLLYDDLLALRKCLGLESHFFFLGFVADASRFMNNLDVFVLPSVSEGFSISTVEAMACGIPVIATRSGGPQEIISSGIDGILVDVCSINKLYESIVMLRENQDLSITLIKNGIKACNNKFSHTCTLEEYEQLYFSLSR